MQNSSGHDDENHSIVSDEQASEASFNRMYREPSKDMTKSLPLPVPMEWQEKKIWCSLTMLIYLVNSDERTLFQIWDLVMGFYTRIGYIRNAGYSAINQRSFTTNSYTISSEIDLHEQLDLFDMKESLQRITGFKCKIVMKSFSFHSQ